MSNTIIEIRHSNVSGNVPDTLANGEIAINTIDGKLFYRGGLSNTIQSIQNFPGPAGLDTEIQFNDSGELGTSSNLTFNKTTNTLNVKNVLVSGNITPTDDIAYNIGAPDKRFHSIFVGPGSVDIGGIVLSNTDGQLSVSGASFLSVGDATLLTSDYFPKDLNFGFLEEESVEQFGLGNDLLEFEIDQYDCRVDPIRSFNTPLLIKNFGFLS
jgi:hypothetical protein